jgi:cupin superfamily acireductone dioxygenase involved in methionine salvage
MAIVRIPDENRTLREQSEVAAYLASIGIEYERWDLPQSVADGVSPEEVHAT